MITGVEYLILFADVLVGTLLIGYTVPHIKRKVKSSVFITIYIAAVIITCALLYSYIVGLIK